MDRVAEHLLTLSDVARFWSRDPGTIYSPAEIIDTLIRAVWRGELAISAPAGHTPRDGDYRQSLLAAVAGARSHPGLLFLRPGEPEVHVETELPDGGVLVDLRERITWVHDGEQPSDTLAAAAFGVLASADYEDYDAATVGPILLGLPIERDALRVYCECAGIPLPKFWFPKGTPTRSSAAAEQRCEKWLKELARKGGKPGSKSALKQESMTKFTGLAGAAFDRAWEKAAPPAWKEPGAPTKATRRKR